MIKPKFQTYPNQKSLLHKWQRQGENQLQSRANMMFLFICIKKRYNLHQPPQVKRSSEGVFSQSTFKDCCNTIISHKLNFWKPFTWLHESSYIYYPRMKQHAWLQNPPKKCQATSVYRAPNKIVPEQNWQCDLWSSYNTHCKRFIATFSTISVNPFYKVW